MKPMRINGLESDAIFLCSNGLLSIVVERWEVCDLDAAIVDMLTLNRQKFPGTKSGFQPQRQTDNESHEGF